MIEDFAVLKQGNTEASSRFSIYSKAFASEDRKEIVMRLACSNTNPPSSVLTDGKCLIKTANGMALI